MYCRWGVEPVEVAPSARHQYWSGSLLLYYRIHSENIAAVLRGRNTEARRLWTGATQLHLSLSLPIPPALNGLHFGQHISGLFSSSSSSRRLGSPLSLCRASLFSLTAVYKSGCLLLLSGCSGSRRRRSAAKSPRWQAGRTARCRRSTGWWWSEAVVSGSQR